MLTKRQREVLTIMRDEEEELVCERGRGYVGYSPVSGRTVMALLQLCAIRMENDSEVGVFERYTINGTGKKILLGDYSDLALPAAEVKKFMKDINRPPNKFTPVGYQVLFLVKVTGLFAAYTSVKRPLDLGMAHAYRAALERQGSPGKIVTVPGGKTVEEWDGK